MREVRNALVEAHPLHLLELVSALLSVTDRREQSPLAPESIAPTLEDLLSSLIAVDRAETTALLTVIAMLSPDELQRARIAREVAGRRSPVPTWLDRLGDVLASGSSEMVHLQRDGDNVMVGVDLPGGYRCTAVVYIDHNLGTLVKDAFILPQDLADTEAAFRELDTGGLGLAFNAIAEADARARISDAVERGREAYPPFETDTWPQCRPLVEWITRLLPAGGTGYKRTEWRAEDRRQLMTQFFASKAARTLDARDRADHRDLLDVIIDYSVYDGTGDPLHWSPVAVEILLADWLPRKLVAPVPFLDKAPALLRAFIGHCHSQRGLPWHLTAEAVAAVDRWLPVYRQRIRSQATDGPLAALAAMGIDVEAIAKGRTFGLVQHYQNVIGQLERQVGGAEMLEELDVLPLVAQPFDWTAVDDADRARVTEVLALCERVCDVLLDDEHRAACRRFLAEVAAGDPSMLTRSTNPAYPAAAICWVIGKANDTFSADDGAVRVKDVMATLGLTGSVADRGYGMVRASGRPRPRSAEDIELGSTVLLVSAQRRRIIERRDRFRDLLDGEVAKTDATS